MQFVHRWSIAVVAMALAFSSGCVPGPDALDAELGEQSAALGNLVGGHRGLALGSASSCVITAGAGVSCWGSNSDGQIGNGTTTYAPSPATVSNLTGVVEIDVGARHACAVLDSGLVRCWGDNASGQLGDGTHVDRTTPVDVPGLSNVRHIALGDLHSCAVLANGTVRCWGSNVDGQLGNTGTADSTSPQTVIRQLPAGLAMLAGAQDISAGSGHTCAVVVGGQVWCWGRNVDGQLGAGAPVPSRVAIRPALPLSYSFRSVAAGRAHSCALTNSGRTYCWGNNLHGQLGTGSNGNSATPVQVSSIYDWSIDVFAGDDHTCVKDYNGRLHCWGRNDRGQLGVFDTAERRTPTYLGIPENVVEAAGGGSHTCHRQADGTVWCWGAGDQGQLGFGAGVEIDADHPYRVPGLAPARGFAIAAGGDGPSGHTCATVESGEMFCWGAGGKFQLGFAATVQSTPRLVVRLFGDPDTVAVDGGGLHTCYLSANQILVCMGDNSFGQLGDGTRNTGVTQNQLAWKAVDVSAGLFHSCKINPDASLDCWGRNDHGQVGVTGGVPESPHEIEMFTPVVAVDAGGYHTCAVLDDKTMRCWGRNQYGQLGNGSTTSSSAPVSVSNMFDAADVALGTYHSCAVASDGSLSCWGYNVRGQLGDGTQLVRTTPRAVSGIPAVVAVTAGTDHTCALAADGGAWCWGGNTFGQLGDGSNTDQLRPKHVAGSDRFVDLTAGPYHTCGLRAAGDVKCWGRNSTGQLGNGGTTNSNVPSATSGF